MIRIRSTPIWRRSALPLLAAALLVAAGALALPSVVSAHANIDRAEPAADSTLASAPQLVRLWFTEPVSRNASGIEVLDTTGRRVDNGDSRVDLNDPASISVTLPPLPDGTYTVAWHNTSSVDGHPLRGTYAFSVGASSGGTPVPLAGATARSDSSWLDPLARAAVLGGLLTALGIEVFGLLVLAPVLGSRDGRGVALEVDRRIVPSALAIFMVGSLGYLVLQLRGQQLAAPALIVTLIGTQWSRMWLLRMVLVGVAAVTQVARADRRFAVASVVLLTLAAGTLAFASHAAATRGVEVTAVANDVVHTLAAAVWVGGLVALWSVVWRVRALSESRRRPLLSAITTRFSPLAMIVTAALLITGLYSTWLQVAAWVAFDTSYGWAVIAKVVAYVALIAVAAVNLLWVTRRLRTSSRAAGALVVTVGVEIVLVLAALFAAGFLTSREPAREAVGQGARQAVATSGSVRARIAVSPGSVGTNRIEVRVDDRGRALLEGTSSVTLRVEYAGADLGARDVALERDATGTYVADRVVLSLEGPWQFSVGVSSPGSFDAQAAARISIAPAGVKGVSLPSQVTTLLAAGWQVVLLALVVLVVAEAWWKRSRAGQIANWGATVLVVVGILMVYGVGHFHRGAPPAAGGRANPVLSTDESIALGRELYNQRCVTCHGARGLGDGPGAVGLNPPPVRLPVHVPLHSDGDLYAFIEAGFPGSAMPAFRGTLTEQQMWHLVNYLRTLKAAAP